MTLIEAAKAIKEAAHDQYVSLSAEATIYSTGTVSTEYRAFVTRSGMPISVEAATVESVVEQTLARLGALPAGDVELSTEEAGS